MLNVATICIFKHSPKIPSVRFNILETAFEFPLIFLSLIAVSASSIIKILSGCFIKKGINPGSEIAAAIIGGTNIICFSILSAKCFMYVVLPVPGSPCNKIKPFLFLVDRCSTIFLSTSIKSSL